MNILKIWIISKELSRLHFNVKYIISYLIFMKTIITHPNFDYLWFELAKNNAFQKAKVRMENFADGWPNIFIEDVKNTTEHKEVVYIWDFSNPSDLFMNFSIIRWILDYYVDELIIILPYFPVWTMERIEEKWEIATAKYFAEILSILPSWRKTKTEIHIFDIHALVERFLFDSRFVNTEIHTAMSILRENIEWKTIVFPDDWAKKRFWKDFLWFDNIVCLKSRVWNERIISVKDWNPEWKDLLIVDDLIQTWWTIKETAIKLKELWAKSVSAFATHGIFPNNSHIKLAKYLDKLIVTDTIPENVLRAKQVENMEVISILKLIEKIVLR